MGSHSICEIQADAVCRSFPEVRIASLRFHHVCPPELANQRGTFRDFWSWTDLEAAARACLQGITSEHPDFQSGHEAFFIQSPSIHFGSTTKEVATALVPGTEERLYTSLHGRDLDTVGTRELVELAYPGVKIDESWLQGEDDRRGLYDTSKAETLLGWKHDL